MARTVTPWGAWDPARDEADFCAALPVLNPFRRKWLHDALVLAYGGHPWRARLRPAR